MADGTPLLVERTYTPVHIIPNLTADVIENNSLYAVMSEHGIRIISAIETFETVLLNQKYAKLLKCESNQPAFLLTRVSTDQRGNICEITHSLMRGDLVKYVIEIDHGQTTVNFGINS
jgi:GntR family transcriptional regulator